MFAGPNGSGKSTFNRLIPAHLKGVYINADDIERAIRETGYFDFSTFSIELYKHDAISFLSSHSLMAKSQNSLAKLQLLSIEGNRLHFSKTNIDSYIASALSDFTRHALIKQRISCTFETVMSYEDKIRVLETAKTNGYRVYVYFVATVDVDINISRVKMRVNMGGHDVPTDRIKDRYTKSLELLADAISVSNRAYIFDNSDDGNENFTLIAEVTEGEQIEIKSDSQPPWFKT